MKFLKQTHLPEQLNPLQAYVPTSVPTHVVVSSDHHHMWPNNFPIHPWMTNHRLECNLVEHFIG